MKLAWDSSSRVDKHDGGYHREKSDELYHTVRWTKLSAAYRLSHPICEECKRHGRLVPAECVDHIIPFPMCEDFFDEKNLQALCNRCNMLKGINDRKKIQEWKRNQRSTR